MKNFFRELLICLIAGFSAICAKAQTEPLAGSSRNAGDEFEYQGIIYIVSDAEAKTCRTKDGGGMENPDVPGENIEVSGNVYEGNLVIPAIVTDGVDEYSVTRIGNMGFYRNTGILSVTLPEGLKEIGGRAFEGCSGMISIDLPNTLTMIEDGSFSGCAGLTSINLPSGITSIGGWTFFDCSGLTSITLPSGITSIWNAAFHGCSSLTSIELPDSLTFIDQAVFKDCSGLTSIYFPEGLASIGDRVFEGCTSLASVSLPNGLMSFGENLFERCSSLASVDLPESLTSISPYAFWECSSLSSIALPSGITSIGPSAFSGCSSLTAISLPEGVTSIEDGAFDRCRGLTSISLPSSLTSIGWCAFQECVSLPSISLPSGVTSIADAAFVGCTGLTSISLPPGVTSIGGSTFLGCSGLTSIDLPSGITSIGGLAFGGCSSLTSISLPSGITFIGSGAFDGCSSLTSIDLPSALTSIEIHLFNGCISLSSIVLPPGITFIDEGAFRDCKSLTSIALPEALQSIDENAFYCCDAIRNVSYAASQPIAAHENLFGEDTYANGTLTMPNATLADIHATMPWRLFSRIIASDGEGGAPLKAGDDFEYQGIIYTVIDAETKTVKTKEGQDGANPGNHYEGALTIPATVTYDNNEYTVVEIGHHGFCSLSGLTSVAMPATVVKLGEAAFYNCENLAAVELPDSLTDVEGFVFDSCVSLTSVILPEGLEYVGERMFAHCQSLVSVTLPGTIKEIRGFAFGNADLSSITLPEELEIIGGEAFTGNKNLTSITFPGKVAAIWDRAFSGCGLTSLVLPESLHSLGDGAFYHNYELESIVLPASIVNIGLDAFGEGDNKLLSVTYNAENPIEANSWIFGQTGELYARATLTMPNATLAAIQAVTPWNLFQRINAMDGSVVPTLKEGEEFEYEGIWYTVIDEDARTVRTKEGDMITLAPGNPCEGALVIPANPTDGTYTYTVVEIGMVGFTGNPITSLTLPNTVTNIGWSAFRDCTEMTELNLPNSLRSTEGDSFQSCLGLKSIVLPESFTTLGGATFSYCRNLESVTIPAGLTEFGGFAFIDCNNITEVNYLAETPLETDSGFEEMVYENAVLNTPNAALADVRATAPWRNFRHIAAKDGSFGFVADGDDFEYEGLVYTIIDSEAKTCKTKDGTDSESGNKFEGDLVIPSIVSDGTDDYTVIEIGVNGFLRSEGLNSVSLPESVRIIGNGAFALTPLTSVIFSEGLDSIGKDAFAYCEKLREVAFPQSLIEIGEEAFRNCDELSNVVFREGIQRIGVLAFLYCWNIDTIVLPQSLTTLEREAFQYTDLRNITYLAENLIEGPDNVFGLGDFTSIYDNATLNLPNAALADAQATLPWSRFAHIVAKDGSIGTSLTAGEDFEYQDIIYTVIDPEAKTCKTKDGALVENPDVPGENIEIPGNIYEGDLVIPVTVTDGIDNYTVIGIGERGFIYNSGMSSVILPETLTSIGYSAFKDCGSLTSINLPSGITSIETQVFSGCVNLTSINLPSGITSIGAGAFYGCSGLTSIDLPSEIKSIEYSTFCGCSGLTSIDLPSGITSIGDWAFFGCTGLTSIDLPSGIISIGFEAFQKCSSLTSIDLPEGIQSIGDGVFSRCYALLSVSYSAAHPISASDNVFTEASYANATLKMPNASLADIQATVPWSLFGRIIAADGEVGGSLTAGDDFEYEGIIYTVIDSEAKTCKTKDGVDGKYGNSAVYDLEIPETATDGIDTYTVTGIGQYGFTGCGYLNSVTLPASIEEIGTDAFAECPRLTSLVWNAARRIPSEVTEAIANPNLLVYVTGEQYAPEGMDANVVVIDPASATAECRSLVVETGYPFGAVRTFDALHSSMTKEFTQTTPIGGCAGWETIVLPFNATRVAVNDARGELTPFALITDITTQYPYWLYQAETGSTWKEAFGIMAGIPYLIAMPNNEDYAERYRISGPVTFSNDSRTTITPATTAPYSLTWASGHEFRSLWLPLDAEEAANAMGLNSGIDNLTDDAGKLLAPGSAFHIDVEPRPLEAYVRRLGVRRALPVMNGGAARLEMMEMDCGLTVTVDCGTVYVKSSVDRHIDIFRADGAHFGSYDLKAGELLKVEGLVRGIYIVGGRKVAI